MIIGYESPTDGAPINVVVEVTSARIVVVRWDPPPANADLISGYVLSYDAVEEFASDGTATSSTTVHTINDLEEFVSYDIRVQADFGGVAGPLSVQVRVMTWSDGKQLCIKISTAILV